MWVYIMDEQKKLIKLKKFLKKIIKKIKSLKKLIKSIKILKNRSVWFGFGFISKKLKKLNRT